MSKFKSFPAIVSSINSKADRSWKITLSTQELTPLEAAELTTFLQKFCFVAIKENDFQPNEVAYMEGMNTDPDLNAKSMSERLRNVLWVYHKQNNKGFEKFKDYYEHEMNSIIDHFKSKLEP